MLELDLKGAAILLIDDQVANISLFRNILSRIGYTKVKGITEAREMMSLMARFKPDLIILDLNMPRMDGFQAMQHLARIIPRDSFLPVLVLTADCSGHTKRKALAAGASDILTKPFNTSEAFVRIENLLRMRMLHLQLQGYNQLLEEKIAKRTAELQAIQRHVVAQERLSAFGEMASGVVHDFNNALMSVIGYSDILLQDPRMLADHDTVRDFLKVINTSGRDAAHVVGRLREFYRPREISDVFAPVDLNKVIEQAVPLTQPKWKDQAFASGQVIAVELDLEKLPPITGNPSELRDMATNLIFNAVDAMPQGGLIVLRTRRIGDEVVFEVSDTGVGMTEEVRSRCLEPFFSTKGEAGTGLGLSMVFGIIKRHEARLEIETELGKGTTFRIKLSSQLQHSEAAPERERRIERSLRVLVVDDEPIPRDVLEKYLIADGHYVMTAASGYEAVDCWRSEKFDLLLTDHGMPGMSGVQLATLVKEMGANQPVILVTGFSDPTAVMESSEGAIARVVSKPVHQSDLRRAVAELMTAA